MAWVDVDPGRGPAGRSRRGLLMDAEALDQDGGIGVPGGHVHPEDALAGGIAREAVEVIGTAPFDRRP